MGVQWEMSKENPLISIVIPNYNHGRFLKERINSVLNQTFQDFEIIILDDCSSDNSLEIVDSFKNHPKIKQVIINKLNSGNTFSQWNKGLEYSQGKFVCFAESDDYWDLNFLESVVSVINQDEQIVLAFCQSLIVNSESRAATFLGFETFPNSKIENGFNADFYMNGLSFIEKYLTKSNLIPNASSVLIRKSRLIEIGGASEDMKLFGDWHTWIMLLIDDAKLYYLNQPLNFFRTHHNTVRNNVSRNYSTLLEYFTIYDLLVDKFPNLKKFIFDTLVFQYLKFNSENHFSKIQKRDIIRKLRKYNKNSKFYIFKTSIRNKIWVKGFQ